MTENHLRRIRRAKDITQAALASAAGVDMTTVSDIERGKNRRPSYETVVRLARALGVEPSDLFTVTDQDAPEAA